MGMMGMVVMVVVVVIQWSGEGGCGVCSERAGDEALRGAPKKDLSLAANKEEKGKLERKEPVTSLAHPKQMLQCREGCVL
jgi:hypothetical protein